jgi:hypothetical protein
MIELIIIAWYLVGFFSCIFSCKHDNGEVTIGDLMLALTFGGFFGLIILIIFIVNSIGTDWINKKIF